jgi:hypothetical protein
MTFWLGPLPSAAALQVDLNVAIADNDGFTVVGLILLVIVLVDGLLIVVVFAAAVVVVIGGLNFVLVSIVSCSTGWTFLARSSTLLLELTSRTADSNR